MTERAFRVFGMVVPLMLAVAAAASAQDVRPAEQAYKNIKVMKGVPANELQQGMHFIKAALGVDCTHCHVEGAFDKDDNPLKDKARAMYLMMTEINRANFGGRQVVTCFTCHKGQATPEGTPSLPVPAVPAETAAAAKPPLPAVDVILAKYIDALGGEAAMRKVTSRVMTASQDIPTGPGGSVPMPATLQRSMKAPNLIVDEFKTDRFTIANGFDGSAAWAKGQNGNVNTLAAGGIDTERIQRAAAFYEPLTIKQQYSAMLVEGTTQVNGHDAYVVMGVSAAKTPERLYFDARSGLLLRKSNYLQTATGPSPFQMDFDDYRDTGSGVKVPFLIRMTPATTRTELESSSTIRVTSVKDNVRLADSVFVRPQPAPRPPQ